MSNTVVRIFIYYICIIYALFSSGCALGERRYSHFVTVENRGQDAVTDVSYSYGWLNEESMFTSSKKLRALYGSTASYGAIMPIGEEATVCWTSAENESYSVTVPVKQYVESPKDFRLVSFLISQGDLYVCVNDEKENCFCFFDDPRACHKIEGPFPAQKETCPLPY